MARPKNVGIKGIEVYFPNQYVDQAELETYDGVSQGKYTVGLGQTRMSFCDDREDTYSLALTAVSFLLRKYNIDPSSIGRLEVGTETILDKSKSVKSVLMQLFEGHNTNIEGADTYNACYGGTNALFNAVNWIESSAWDGRDAIVVAADIAAYDTDRAKPTGGAGSVAMLIGPNAPLKIEPGLRGNYMRHTYDFYKPDFSKEYPYVDGHLSLRCYGEALDGCYNAYLAREKVLSVNGTNGQTHDDGTENDAEFDSGKPASVESPADRFDYMCFHSPTCKTVMKSYARLYFNDFLADPTSAMFKDVPPELKDTANEAEINRHFLPLTKKRFGQRVQPATHLPSQCGNMYTASLYSSLCSLLTFGTSTQLKGKTIGMFSYGSGLSSSMFSLKVVGSVEEMKSKLDLVARLEARKQASPEAYQEARNRRDFLYGKKGHLPTGSVEHLSKGTYYLAEVDEMYRRAYRVKG
ncbi:hypothetical protein JX265_012302 [Neoarthrinium moseri]|uniref:Hydroxymethylglutaryl-CoA synthase n=1 Tax=Neoarthrinium moseri TaxID=1658444 RepID=A0A9P9WAJ0_9PEZI|nr:hypothetical protein JX265_012302 [Neoarthrinium moseri]